MVDDKFVLIDFKMRAKNLNQNVRRRYPERKDLGTIKAGALLSLWVNSDGKCKICRSEQDITIDHIQPLKAGGSNTFKNLQLLCKGCNEKKGAMIYGPELQRLQSALKSKQRMREIKKERRQKNKQRRKELLGMII